MKGKKYNSFVIDKQKPKTKAKHLLKPKTKLEVRVLSLENKKEFDIIYAKGFVKRSKKYFRGITMTITLTRARAMKLNTTIAKR